MDGTVDNQLIKSMNIGFSFHALSWKETGTSLMMSNRQLEAPAGEKGIIMVGGCVLTQLLVYSTIEME